MAKPANLNEPSQAGPQPTNEQIAQRAYEIYLENGQQPGRDLDNWLQAEAELTGGRQAAPTRPPAQAASEKPASASARSDGAGPAPLSKAGKPIGRPSAARGISPVAV